MAKPTTVVGSNVYIALETGTAGTFARPCGLTSHTINFSKNTTDITVPDCDDLEAPAWIERGVESLEMSGSGSGVLAVESEEIWWDAFASTESVNARIYVGAPTAPGAIYYAGKIHVTGFEVGGERGGKANVTLSFASDGPMTRNAVTPLMEPHTVLWASGEDDFLLRIGEVEALDDLTPDGAMDLRYRLSQGVSRGSLAYAPVRAREVMACLRLGLMGAGMDRQTAERKVRQAWADGDAGELNLLAYTILSRAFAGKEHDPAGERVAGETEAASGSPASTATERQ